MKSILAIILISSFAATAIFGFVFMNHAWNTGHGGCLADIAATAKGSPCPAVTGSLDFALFHLDTWQSFSQAVFGGSVLATFLLILILGAGLIFLRFLAPPTAKNRQSAQPLFQSFFSTPRSRLIRWLALHENSPAIP